MNITLSLSKLKQQENKSKKKKKQKKALYRTITNIVTAWNQENDVCSVEKLEKKDEINLNFVYNQLLD